MNYKKLLAMLLLSAATFELTHADCVTPTQISAVISSSSLPTTPTRVEVTLPSSIGASLAPLVSVEAGAVGSLNWEVTGAIKMQTSDGVLSAKVSYDNARSTIIVAVSNTEKSSATVFYSTSCMVTVTTALLQSNNINRATAATVIASTFLSHFITEAQDTCTISGNIKVKYPPTFAVTPSNSNIATGPLSYTVALATSSPTAPTAPTTRKPTRAPTSAPTSQPTFSPVAPTSTNPTSNPSRNPTKKPTKNPTKNPTRNPTTSKPTTRKPTSAPTKNPTYPTQDVLIFQLSSGNAAAYSGNIVSACNAVTSIPQCSSTRWPFMSTTSSGTNYAMKTLANQLRVSGSSPLYVYPGAAQNLFADSITQFMTSPYTLVRTMNTAGLPNGFYWTGSDDTGTAVLNAACDSGGFWNSAASNKQGSLGYTLETTSGGSKLYTSSLCSDSRMYLCACVRAPPS